MDETKTEPSESDCETSILTPNIPTSIRSRLSSSHLCGHYGQSTELLFSDADMERRDCWRVWEVLSPLFRASPFILHCLSSAMEVLSVSCPCVSLWKLCLTPSIWKVGIYPLNRTQLEEEKWQSQFVFILCQRDEIWLINSNSKTAHKLAHINISLKSTGECSK